MLWHKSVSKVTHRWERKIIVLCRAMKVTKCVFWQCSYWSCTPNPQVPHLSEPAFCREPLKAWLTRNEGWGCYCLLEGYLPFDGVQNRKCWKVSVTWDMGLKGFTTLNSWQAAKVWADPPESRPPSVFLIPVGWHRIGKRGLHTLRWLWFASYPERSTAKE